MKVALVEWKAVPGEPEALIVTGKVPADEELHVRVAVVVALAPRVMVEAGLKGWQERPAAVRPTLPAKLNVLFRTMVEVADSRTFTAAGEVADTRKSPTWTVADDEWDVVPGDPEPLTVIA